jgi:hypothetical protein
MDQPGPGQVNAQARRARFGERNLVLALLLSLIALPLFADPLQTRDSRYYTLHTDVSDVEAREAALRLDKSAELYLRQTEGFAGKIHGRLPVYLYNDPADYQRAGGAKGSAGVFDGEKLLLLAIRRTDGRLATATWRILQHEGFHQFARAVIGGNIPTWANEGLAEYFGEAIFTGDGFVTGLVSPERLGRIRTMLKDGGHPPLGDFLTLSPEAWDQPIDRTKYDLAWSLIHFFAHAANARYADPFAHFMQDVSTGVDPLESFVRRIGPIKEIEKAWREYWRGLGDNPTADRYARATVAILTGYLARAHARGDRFESFEVFVRTPPAKLEFVGETWLPASLWRLAVEETETMRREGARSRIVRTQGGLPSVEAVLPDGTTLTGTFRKVGEVVVELKKL